MIYQAYSAQTSVLDFLRPFASSAGRVLRTPWPFVRPDWPARKLAGILETFADLDPRLGGPPYQAPAKPADPR